jgi:hypothetical protein
MPPAQRWWCVIASTDWWASETPVEKNAYR